MGRVIVMDYGCTVSDSLSWFPNGAQASHSRFNKQFLLLDALPQFFSDPALFGEDNFLGDPGKKGNPFWGRPNF